MTARPFLQPLEPRRLFATFTVVNSNNAGAGSLRQAMLDANATTAADTINFNIPGGGVQTISLSSLLPVMTTPMVVDARTQPGWAATAPKIQLDGRFLSGFSVGFDINASDCAVYGTALIGFTNGVAVFGSNNIVAANFIGMRADGVTRESGFYGVTVQSGSGNQVGTAAAGGNLIAFGTPTLIGVGISVANTALFSIRQNLIGLKIDGSTASGSRGEGIAVSGTATGTIGVSSTTGANTISGITGNGIVISGANVNVNIYGNTIGLNVARNAPAGNTVSGVLVTAGAAVVRDGNHIAFNGGNGVTVIDAGKCQILTNLIANNGGLGIDLGNDGVTPNDAADVDTGPNGLQNYPAEITARILPNNKVRVRTALRTFSDAAIAFEIYQSPDIDPSGFGEGYRPVAGGSGTLGASGAALLVGEPAYNAGEPYFSTIVDTVFGTSEFGPAVKAFRPGDMDGNGTINNNDIAGFVQALTNPTAYAAAFPGIPIGPYGAGDINDDGAFNNNDIAPFVALLTAGRPAPSLAATTKKPPAAAPADDLDVLDRSGGGRTASLFL